MDDAGYPDAYGEDAPARTAASRHEWEELPSDPDLHVDLGYALLDLEVYETEDGSILFLPKDEDMLRDEAYIIVRRELVSSLEE